MIAEVTKTREYGMDVYSFNANNTNYTVMTKDRKTWEVWSNRNSLSYNPQIKLYGSLEEMAQRSKALANLAKLIKN